MKTLFAFCVFFLLAGSRFSDGAIAAGIFRSVHAVDLLFPVLLLCCARQLRATVASMPSTVHGLWLLWLACVCVDVHFDNTIRYCFTNFVQ